MKIYSWNVNGLRAAAKKGFADWLLSTDADIVCIQEVKAEHGQLGEDLTQIPGYTLTVCSAQRKGYSGTAVYLKNDSPELAGASVSCGLADSRWNDEGRVTRVDTTDFILFNVYFPNGGSGEDRRNYKNSFNEVLKDELTDLKNEGRNIIVCGDVNIAHQPIDLKNPKTNEKHSGFLPEERRFLDRFLAAGFIDTFRNLHPDEVRYSWWSYRFNARSTNAGWRIDYFFISESLVPALQEAAVLDDVQGSDHCPVMLDLKLSEIR
ncbi:MAG: exodeoxyribonuclease III [Eubacteriaceae bacterium]|jgi:exodeoxyribonuclease-3